MEKLECKLLEKYYILYNEKKYKKNFYTYKYSEVIQDFIDFGIYDYDSKYGSIIDEENINKKIEKEIVLTSQKELKLKLIPLILFLDEELYGKLYLENFFGEIIDYIIEDFKKFKINIDYSKININSFQYENMLSLEKGLEKVDYAVIANFNVNFDIGSCQYSRFINYLAEKMFFNEYCKILDDKDKLTFLYLLFDLEDKQDIKKRLKILNYLDKNKIFLEINILNKILLKDIYIKQIKEIVFDFSCDKFIWQSFLRFYLEYPSRNPQLFLPLSEVLNQSQYDVIGIFIDTVKINQYLDDNSKEALNNCILKIKNDEIQEYIMKKIFIRWKSFINNYEDYMGNLFLTDVIDIVIVYAREFLSKETIEREIKKLIFNIEEIDNKWFNNSSEQGNYLYKQLSKLFIYGFALEKYDLFDSKNEIKYLLQNIENNLKSESVHKTKSTLQLFNEYIIKEIM